MKINNGAAGVHEKSELQFFQAKFWVGFRVKEKIGVGFRGLFFFVSFFWRSKRKKNADMKQRLIDD
ncbi:MAG: hypothetical protein V4549_18570 [Bacteroidota bacterium]